MKHKTEDYKNSAVKYYLKNSKSFSKTCKVFHCKKSSLQSKKNIFEIFNNSLLIAKYVQLFLLLQFL